MSIFALRNVQLTQGDLIAIVRWLVKLKRIYVDSNDYVVGPELTFRIDVCANIPFKFLLYGLVVTVWRSLLVSVLSTFFAG